MFDLMPWKKRESKDIIRFRSELDKLFDRFFDMDFPAARELLEKSDWFPSIDVSEGEKEITVKAEIPGVDVKDIDIAIDGKRLMIKGEKKQEKEEKNDNYHRMERSYGVFNRNVELPAEVSAEDVDASYKKGILKIVMKKTKTSETKKISVKTN